ncbi:hypothetical protein [Salipiger sp.]|uniref:hypothetical protein n=1 Tax=Salipiger sp. TaxID=2078585 RepID=UPI003A983D0D
MAPGDASIRLTLQPDAASIPGQRRRNAGNRGLVLQSPTVGARSAEVRFRNPTFPSSAQAVGRVARIHGAASGLFETFEIVPVSANGTPARASPAGAI